VICLIIGLGFAALGDDFLLLGEWVLFVVLIAIAYVPAIVVHELGHAVTARLAGLELYTVTIGTGPLRAVLPMLGGVLEFRTYPLSGGITRSYFRDTKPARWRRALMVAGGPLANLIAAILVGSAFAVAGSAIMEDWLWAAALIWVVAGTQLVMMVNALIPRRIAIGGHRLPSDGLTLIELWRNRSTADSTLFPSLWFHGNRLLREHRDDEALSHFEAAYERLPQSGAMLALLVHTAAKVQGHRAAVEYYLKSPCAADPFAQPDKDGFAFAYTNVAWCAALSGDETLLDLADRLSRHALEMRRLTADAQGARGAVLSRQGHLEEGAAMLGNAIRACRTFSDKAELAAELSAAERLRGDMELAQEFSSLAQHCRAASLHQQETR
jgi:tetratricopeptide (TPR) repeat protein